MQSFQYKEEKYSKKVNLLPLAGFGILIFILIIFVIILSQISPQEDVIFSKILEYLF